MTTLNTLLFLGVAIIVGSALLSFVVFMLIRGGRAPATRPITMDISMYRAVYEVLTILDSHIATGGQLEEPDLRSFAQTAVTFRYTPSQETIDILSQMQIIR